jgi:hypothetical protein
MTGYGHVGEGRLVPVMPAAARPACGTGRCSRPRNTLANSSWNATTAARPAPDPTSHFTGPGRAGRGCWLAGLPGALRPMLRRRPGRG